MQPTLFEESRFQQYHKENPAVYEVFTKFTDEAIRAGRRKIGAKMIAERMRWEHTVSGNDGYKINNSYIAHYARLYENEHPEHRGLFQFRRAKADMEIAA